MASAPASWPCSPSWAAESTRRPPTWAPTSSARLRRAFRGRPAQRGRHRGPRRDNVGDCAGRGADLFESTAAENIGAMILGGAVYVLAFSHNWPHPRGLDLLPARRSSLRSHLHDRRDVLHPRARRLRTDEILNRGLLGHDDPERDLAGLRDSTMMQTAGRRDRRQRHPHLDLLLRRRLRRPATSIAFVYITQYYTAGNFRPVREIAEASKTGPAPTSSPACPSALRRPLSPQSPSASPFLPATGSGPFRTRLCWWRLRHRSRDHGHAHVPRHTSWRWTPSAPSPTTRAASPSSAAPRPAPATSPTASMRSATRPRH